MRAVVQRVIHSRVVVENKEVGGIGAGMCVLLGVCVGDEESDARYLAQKIAKLRIFADEEGKMNRSLLDIGGEAMVISQFTLLGDARGQNRPGFTKAEAPDRANELYLLCCETLRESGVKVVQGVFGAHMQIELTNDGPVTILLDSKKEF